MKTERKFIWCVRYYNVMTGAVDYRMYTALSTREINETVEDFIESHSNYVVRIFKLYKTF